MKTLILSTCTNRIIVTLVDDSTIFSFCNEIIENQMSNIIMSKIDECFKKANLKPNDIDKILVAVGPGSYTGIRIGVTIAKTFAWTLNKPIIPISSLELLISGYNEDALLVPYIDARRNCVFAAVYNKNLDIILEERYISLTKLNEFLKEKDYLFISDDHLVDSTEPKIDLLKIANKYKADMGLNPHSINPIYLKQTEAEENLKND
ncbi:MAG: tRNA (adenosine(37)-N6)-threonylcarbamoyltransferase complex dimerization subunit type 1 TsaB [Bacilli bacterium]|nr:tRNA (adenosine(37)-N6)-threonylcarbamoyltransferase complex dimerization subunit type 1 TsaB [Bacilli bacterium]